MANSATAKEDYLKKYLSADSVPVQSTSKAEYLKKYVSGDDPASKKKRKRRKKVHQNNLGYKIIDDDIDVKHNFTSADASDNGPSDDEVPFVVSIEDESNFKTKLDPKNWIAVGGSDDNKNKDASNLLSDMRRRHDSSDSSLSNITTKHQNKHAKKDVAPLQSFKSKHDSDESPPRLSRKSDRDQYSPQTRRARTNSDSDQSPPRSPRIRAHIENNDYRSRTSKVSHDSSSDQSAPRRSTTRHDSDSDLSPPRTSKTRQNSGRDQSPPRMSKVRRYSGDLSPLRPSKDMNKDKISSQPAKKQRHDSDSDQSPLRRTGAHKNSVIDLSTTRSSNTRHDSDSDVSVPRKTRENHSDSDQSPPRTSRSKNSPNKDTLSYSKYKTVPSNKRRHSPYSYRDKSREEINKKYVKDISWKERSPERKSSKSKHDSERASLSSRSKKTHLSHDSNNDLSPPQKNIDKKYSSHDHSPHPSKSSYQGQSPRRHKDESLRNDHDRPEKTLSGLKAGLQTAKVLRTELEEAKAREKHNFKQIGDDVSGKGAQTVFRDRSTGKLRDLKKETEEEQMKKAKENEMKAKYTEWGKGLKQQDDRRKQIIEEQHEMSKPLARYEGDEDLERHLREQERDGDPMLQFIRKKKSEGKNTLPTYQGPPPPPNRFNILPGYRWDGVDRSNGFEKKLFERQSSRVALEEEAYKWSTENM